MMNKWEIINPIVHNFRVTLYNFVIMLCLLNWFSIFLGSYHHLQSLLHVATLCWKHSVSLCCETECKCGHKKTLTPEFLNNNTACYVVKLYHNLDNPVGEHVFDIKYVKNRHLLGQLGYMSKQVGVGLGPAYIYQVLARYGSVSESSSSMTHFWCSQSRSEPDCRKVEYQNPSWIHNQLHPGSRSDSKLYHDVALKLSNIYNAFC